MRCIAALAVLAASAAFADDGAEPPTQLDPLTVHPRHDDPLLESDRKLKELTDKMPCMGCDAIKHKPDGWKETAKDIGKAMLNQITPMNPEPRDEGDPNAGPADLSPDTVSKGKPSTDAGRVDPGKDPGPFNHDGAYSTPPTVP